jgi:hypothetical protein
LHSQSMHSISELGAEGRRVDHTISNWPLDNLHPLPAGGGSYWQDKHLFHASACWFTLSICSSKLSQFGGRASSGHLPDLKRLYLQSSTFVAPLSP